MTLNVKEQAVDTAAVFERWLRLAYPEPILVCGIQLHQADVILSAAPLAYVSMFQEWLAQEILDGHLVSHDGGATYYARVTAPERQRVHMVETHGQLQMSFERSQAWGVLALVSPYA
jgi:hypothetical protein